MKNSISYFKNLFEICLKNNFAKLGSEAFQNLEYSFSEPKLFSVFEAKKYLNDNGLKNNPKAQECLNKFKNGCEGIQEKTKQDLDEVAEIITGESTNFITNVLTGNNFDRSEMWEEVNRGKLEKILSSVPIDELYQEVSNSILGNKSFTPLNIGNLKSVLSKYGYEPNGFLGGIEAGSIVSIIKDTKNTQDRIKSGIGNSSNENLQSRIAGMKEGDILKLLVDFNMDGVLDNKVNFNSKELEALYAINDGKTFDTVLTNLGFEDPSNFRNKIQDNYFSARKDFSSRLAMTAEIPNFSLRQLLLPKDLYHESNNYLSTLNNAEKIIDGLAESNPKIKQIKEKKPEAWEEIRRNSINISVGAVNGASVTVDGLTKKLSEVTNGLLNSVTFGMGDSGLPTLFIGGTKNLGDRFSVSAGLANAVPILALSGTLKEADVSEIKELFPSTMDSSIAIGAGGAMSVLGGGGGITMGLENEKSSAGIKAMVKEMGLALDTMLDKIDSGVSFENSGLDKLGFEINGSNRDIYNKFVSMYKSMGGMKSLIPMIKTGALKVYQNELYRNASGGINFNKLTLGMFGPFLGIGIGGERLSQEYVNKDTSLMDNWINEKVGGLSYGGFNSRLDSYHQEAIDNTIGINEKLSEKITAEDAKKLKGLAESIHLLLNGEISLDQTWNKFLSEMKRIYGPGVAFPGNLGDKEKILILQNVAINLMKKPGLKIDGSKVSIVSGMTIEGYDEKYGRASYFDTIFKNEGLGDLLTHIQKARVDYYRQFGKNSSFDIGQLGLKDGISLSGVHSGKEEGLNPYVLGNIAEFAGIPGKIPLDAKGPGVVNKLPNHILDSLILQIEQAGYQFKTNDKYQEMKDLINSGGLGEMKINYNLFFAKDPQCLNDKILIDLNVDVPGKELDIKPWSTYVAENRADSFGITYIRDTKKPEPEPEPEPEEPEIPDTPPPEDPKIPPEEPEEPKVPDTPPPEDPKIPPAEVKIDTTPGMKVISENSTLPGVDGPSFPTNNDSGFGMKYDIKPIIDDSGEIQSNGSLDGF